MEKSVFNIVIFQVLIKIKCAGEENSELLVAWLFYIRCIIDFKYLLHSAFHICLWTGWIVYWGHIGVAMRLLSVVHVFIAEVGKYVVDELETVEESIVACYCSWMLCQRAELLHASARGFLCDAGQRIYLDFLQPPLCSSVSAGYIWDA